MESPERPAVIYALTEPDTGEVRYIGQTRNLWRRYAAYLAGRSRPSKRLRAWLADLQYKHKFPVCVVLEEVTVETAKAREQWWIRHYDQQGAGLVNAILYKPGPSPREPLFTDPEDNTTERWNLYLKRGLRVRIEALAQARGIAASRVVQELLWTALNDRGSSTP